MGSGLVEPPSDGMDIPPLFVVSAHLDDAVLSCGKLLALHPGSTVCTVFAGKPRSPMSTSWDRSAGFMHSDAALDERIREDKRALDIIGAHGVRLPFLDSQYECSPSVDEIAAALADAWCACGCPPLIAPFGLYHSDHALASDACCRLLAARQLPAMFVYEDALYRRVRWAPIARRETLAERGFRLDAHDGAPLAPISSADSASRKWRAVRAYRSQLLALADPYPHDCVEPEHYWLMRHDAPSYRRAASI